MLPGPTELIVILVIIMIVFGAGRLPEVFGALGEGLRSFREGAQGTADDTLDGSTSNEALSTSEVVDAEVVSESSEVRSEG